MDRFWPRYLSENNVLLLDVDRRGIYTGEPAELVTLKTGTTAWVEKRWSPEERETKIALLEKLDAEHAADDNFQWWMVLLGLSIIPPLLVLGIAWVAMWIGRGFQHRA